MKGKAKDSNGMPEETHFFFYQAADGQNVFLQPLAFRCLLKEYGSLDKLPQKVKLAWSPTTRTHYFLSNNTLTQ